MKRERSFFYRDTVTVARDLIGTLLIHQIQDVRISGIIVEAEAYRAQDDPASHAYKGPKKRNLPMFGPVGHSYRPIPSSVD